MKYIQVLNGLSETLNTKRDKKTPEKMVYFLKILKNDFGKNLSTKFLKDLLVDKTNREKTKRISYLLRRANLKTERKQRFFREWVNNKWRGDITEYAHSKNGTIYKNECVLSDSEQEQLNAIRGIEEKHGVALYPTPLKNLEERQHRRDIINREGGVFVKNCYSQTFGRECRQGKKEVLFFVVI